ncbi:MAG: tRNA-specific 2-thiouridylase MnmA [Bacteroidota bacterium]
MAKIVVGMSGGVDSSVVALLLKQQGHEVIGLFMRNWNDASVTLEDECPWIDDSRDAMLVAEHLGIPFQVLDLSDLYKERIVDYMFAEYGRGRTPNPDVLCNREIKFDVFLDEALKLGADFVATGHYVRKEAVEVDGVTEYRLMSGRDANKDQSYFLCQLNQFQLSKALFPIGDLEKSEVRRLAEAGGLVTAAKKDSQGLCFIGHVRLPDFLQQQLSVKEGDVIEIDPDSEAVLAHKERVLRGYGIENPAVWHAQFQRGDGKVIAKHNGAHFYTRGQRRGLQIGGKPLPLFVLQTDVEENVIYVGQGENHWGLISSGLFVSHEEAHWVRPSLKEGVLESSELQCRFRYRQALVGCKLLERGDGYQVVFSAPDKAVTAGQFVSIYWNDEIVFSGAIA